MGYVKVKYQRMLDILDNRYFLPIGWNEFVEKNCVKHNLIFKGSKSTCTCSHCGHTFESKTKVNDYEKCPSCNNKYLVKRNNLRRYVFKDVIAFVDKVDNDIIVRYFELCTWYCKDNESNKFKNSAVEFAREFVDCKKYDYYDTPTYINERVSKNQGEKVVYHFDVKNRWRSYDSYRTMCGSCIVFPDNMQEVLKDTEYQYSMLWELVKTREYIRLIDLFSLARRSNNIEMLVKAKLYNLAFEADKFTRNGSFERIFELPKTFYKFMKRFNITYDQLEILRLLKKEDIKAIRYLEKYSIYDLKEIAKYISLYKFINYSKMKKRKLRTYIYKDYLRFASFLGYDLKNPKYLYPVNLEEQHDILEEQYEIANKELIDKKINERGKVLSINLYKNKEYFVIPAPSYKALLDESKQQQHCVRTYAEKYADGECDIYFMRNNNSPEKSLVTIEVRENKIVQSRAKHNNSPSEKEKKFLQKWENKVLRKAA